MPTIDYEKLLSPERFGEEKTNTTIQTALSSDKSRVIFSSVFRRLQQKAQVFGLESNASVRSRLTHTLEVANTGSTIAKNIAEELVKDHEMDDKYKVPFIDITETCCLLHDVGNPPFGHFGEAAIQKWFKENWRKVFTKTLPRVRNETTEKLQPKEINKELSTTLINDFLYFDGNPQGIRIILHLQNLPGKYTGNGFNLTYSQIYAGVKYIADPNDVSKKKSKKAGYFHSEKDKIEKIKSHFEISSRFPITYIMEAADDISYCLSDIEDGIEKKIISAELFFKELFTIWEKPPLTDFEIDKSPDDLKTDEDFFNFKIKITRNLIRIATKLFLENQEKIKTGELKDLLDLNEHSKAVLAALKQFSRIHLFRSREAENIELAGYKVIFGLLECFSPLLEINYSKFKLLVDAKNKLENISNEKLDVEWRLYNRLPKKHTDAYEFAINEILESEPEKVEWKEWYYRCHLIIDYISGMTDNFALEMYRLLNGITI